MADKYADTNANPYADGTANNEAENINTKTVNRGDKLVYQVWLDTTKFDAANKDNIQSVGISDDYDETKLDLDATKTVSYTHLDVYKRQAPSGKKAEPFIQNGYEVGKSITDLVAAGHKLTEAERALYTAVYNLSLIHISTSGHFQKGSNLLF